MSDVGRKQVTKTLPTEQPDLIGEPATVSVLLVIGWISIASGAICLAIGFGDASPGLGFAGCSAITTGVALIGFSSGLGLLTRISNLLARLLHKPEPEKPAPVPPPKPAPSKEEPYRL